MINSYTSTSQAVLTGTAVNFNTNKIRTGCTVTHAEGTTTFSLNKPGFYFVSFNGIGSTTADAGDVTIQMYQNGAPVIGALTTNNSTAATDINNFAFSTIVQVRPNCCAVNNNTSLTFVNTGVGATYTNVNVVITKLC